MNNRTAGITEEFTLWLNRYTPRNTLKADPAALQAEITALMRALLRMAPVSGYLEWLQKVTDNLDRQMKTAAWPTVSEVASSAAFISKGQPQSGETRADQWKIDPVAIAAKRMNAGEAVGDDWLYGLNAAKLEQSGLVGDDIFRRYRSAVYFSHKEFYGEEIARAKEAQWIARHEESSRHHRENPISGRLPRVAIKRMESREYDGAA